MIEKSRFGRISFVPFLPRPGPGGTISPPPPGGGRAAAPIPPSPSVNGTRGSPACLCPPAPSLRRRTRTNPGRIPDHGPESDHPLPGDSDGRAGGGAPRHVPAPTAAQGRSPARTRVRKTPGPPAGDVDSDESARRIRPARQAAARPRGGRLGVGKQTAHCRASSPPLHRSIRGPEWELPLTKYCACKTPRWMNVAGTQEST